MTYQSSSILGLRIYKFDYWKSIFSWLDKFKEKVKHCSYKNSYSRTIYPIASKLLAYTHSRLLGIQSVDSTSEVDLLGLEIVVQRIVLVCLRVASVFSGFLKRDWLERRRRSGEWTLWSHLGVCDCIFCVWFDLSLLIFNWVVFILKFRILNSTTLFTHPSSVWLPSTTILQQHP